LVSESKRRSTLNSSLKHSQTSASMQSETKWTWRHAKSQTASSKIRILPPEPSTSSVWRRHSIKSLAMKPCGKGYLRELSKTVKSERLFGPSSKAMRAHEQHGQVASLTAPRKNLSLNNLKIKADMFNKCSTCSMCLWMVHIKMISSNQTLTQVYPHAQSPLTYTPGRTHLDLRMTRRNVGQHVWHLRNTWNTQNTRNWNLLSISQEQVADIKSQNPCWSLRPPHRLSATLPAAEHPKSPSASTYTGEMERHGADK